jgi:hypothetical protein
VVFAPAIRSQRANQFPRCTFQVNAREAELTSESKKLWQKSKAKQESDAAQKERVRKIDAPRRDVPSRTNTGTVHVAVAAGSYQLVIDNSGPAMFPRSVTGEPQLEGSKVGSLI